MNYTIFFSCCHVLENYPWKKVAWMQWHSGRCIHLHTGFSSFALMLWLSTRIRIKCTQIDILAINGEKLKKVCVRMLRCAFRNRFRMKTETGNGRMFNRFRWLLCFQLIYSPNTLASEWMTTQQPTPLNEFTFTTSLHNKGFSCIFKLLSGNFDAFCAHCYFNFIMFLSLLYMQFEVLYKLLLKKKNRPALILCSLFSSFSLKKLLVDN